MPQRSSKPAGQSTGTHALISTPDQWAKLWSAIGAGDAPEIDLAKNAVLSLRVPKGRSAPCAVGLRRERAHAVRSPGRLRREDYEYAREGTCNLFLYFALHERWWHLEVAGQYRELKGEP